MSSGGTTERKDLELMVRGEMASLVAANWNQTIDWLQGIGKLKNLLGV